MNLKLTILEYLRLIRLHSSGSTAAILLLGALLMGQRDIFLLSIVFIIGLLGHFFGFALNDYIDVEIDRTSSELQKKPLVSGNISKKHVLILVTIIGLIAYFLTIYYFRSLFPIILLSLTAILGILYDIFSKKFPGSDLLVSGSLVLFFFFGASTVSVEFTNVIYIVGLALFFDFIFLNAVEGGLKDAEHDYKAGAKNLPAFLGIHIKNGKLVTTGKFLFLSYSLKGIFIVLMILLSLQPEIDLWYSKNYILQAIAVILVILVIIITYKMMNIGLYTRSKVQKLYTAMNSTSLALIIILLYPIIGIWYTIFLLIMPIAWYAIFNLVLYGKALQPRV